MRSLCWTNRYRGMKMGLVPDFSGLVIVLAVAAVFGLWKLAELVVWLVQHVTII